MTGESETVWRNRFILINLVRIGGTLIVLLGLYVWHGDLVQVGGDMLVGLPLTIGGLVASFWGPKWLSARWRTPKG